jgi:hypothetical protein
MLKTNLLTNGNLDTAETKHIISRNDISEKEIGTNTSRNSVKRNFQAIENPMYPLIGDSNLFSASLNRNLIHKNVTLKEHLESYDQA